MELARRVHCPGLEIQLDSRPWGLSTGTANPMKLRLAAFILGRIKHPFQHTQPTLVLNEQCDDFCIL